MSSYEDPRWYTRSAPARLKRGLLPSIETILPRFLVVMLLSIAFIGAIFVTRSAPGWFASAGSIHDPKDRLTAELSILQFAAQTLGGTFVLLGLYFTWRNLRLGVEGQVTDRFNKAVDHVGSEKLEIRLGGIFALARIARDSPTDRSAIYEILSAYVRLKSADPTGTPEAPNADIQAALTVLANRPISRHCAKQVLDLTGARLRGADLNGGNFTNASFRDADLARAQFYAADLRAANFAGAGLQYAYLRDARISHSNLTSADLSNASLRGCDCAGVLFAGTRLAETSLIDADLRYAKYLTKEQISRSVVDNTRLPDFG
jgi:uncharacterized protein YjbI with pentapeptide repeats